MDVFDLQASLTLDTSQYEEALKKAMEKYRKYDDGLGKNTDKNKENTKSTYEHRDAVMQAGDAVSELSQKLGGGLKTAATVGSAALGAFSSAAIAATGKAVKEFSQYEQLVGGVDTLFKDSSAQVQKYAAQAYKTAGMSANQYMETVTGFSASLLQSLGNDTAKAAEIGDMAIRDMSDNANKMGTSMESIQYAYQGFAKQNYTMLDNLKLGYGGTKEEMQRLLEDAEKISGIHYDLSNLSDVYNAIHVIQGEIGITGTTAKEASETIEGSFNSAKAAVTNLLTGFGRSDADIEKLFEKASDAVGDLAKNAIPVAEKALVAVTKTAITNAKDVANALTKTLGTAITDTHKLMKKELGASAGGLFDIEAAAKAAAAGFVAFKAAGAVSSVAESVEKVNEALKQGVTLTEALNSANIANPFEILAVGAVSVGTFLKSEIDTQTDLIDEASETYSSLSDFQKELIENSDKLANTIPDDIKATKDAIASVNTEVGGIEKMRDELYKLDDAENLSNEQKAKMKTLVDSLNDAMPDLNLQLDEETGHLKNQRGEIDKLIESYKQQAKAQAAQEKLVQLYKDQFDAEENLNKASNERAKARQDYDNLLWESYQLESRLRKLNSAATNEQIDEYNAVQARLDVVNEKLRNQKNAIGDLDAAFTIASESVNTVNDSIDATSIIAEQASGAMDKVSESSDGAAESIDSAADAIQRYGDVTLQNVNGINEMTFELNGKTVRLTEETAESIAGLIDNYDQMVESQRQAIESSVDFFGGFEADTSTTFDELYNNLNNTNYYLNDWAAGIEQLGEKGISQGLLDELKGMGLDSWKYVYALNHSTQPELEEYSKLWDDTHKDISTTAEEQMSGLKDSTDKAIQDMIGVPKARMGEIMDKFSQIGINADEGLANGLREHFGEVERSVAEGIDNNVIAPAENELDEHSPSKKFWDIGMNVDIGLANGIRDNSGEVAQAARDMAQDLINAVQTEIDSHSPSRVMEKLGVTVPQGLAVGVDEDTQKVIAAAKKMTDSLIGEVAGAGLSDIYSYSLPSLTAAVPPVHTVKAAAAQSPDNGTVDEALLSMLSGNVTINMTLNDSGLTKLASVIVPKIDAVMGRTITLSNRGIAR